MIIINLLLSGYIIFPFPAVDLFNFDWEYPKQLAQNYKSTIISWARIPRTPSAEVIIMPFSQWFPIWFLRQADSHTPIFVFFLTSGVSYWGWNLLRIKKLFNSTNQNRRIRLSLFILYLNLLYWFITAPDFRFSYAVLILIIILHTLDIIYKPLKSIFVSSTVFNIYTAANLLILSITIFLNAQIFSNSNLWKTILVTPLGYYSESVEKIEHNGITFTSPIKGDQC